MNKLIIALFCISSLVNSDSYFPPEINTFRINNAISHIDKFLADTSEEPFFIPYIDRAWLLKVDEENVWFVSVIFPRIGYRFFVVHKSGAVKRLVGEELEIYLKLSRLIQE